jgi:hypothetical protein
MTGLDEHEAGRSEAGAKLGHGGIGRMVRVVHDGFVHAKDAYGSANSARVLNCRRFSMWQPLRLMRITGECRDDCDYFVRAISP